MQRRTFQLGGGLMVAFIMPYLLRIALMGGNSSPAIDISASGNLLGVLAGYYLYRSLTVYPGIRPGLYIVPCFLIAYMSVLLGFLVFRLDYSRFVFTLGLASCCAWFGAVFIAGKRERRMSIGVVPFGDVGSLLDIEGFEWTVLSAPGHPADLPFDTIAGDLRADLPDAWDRFLADCALAGKPVYHAKQLRESITGRVEIDHLSENNFGSLIPNSTYRQIKLVIDTVTAFAALIVLALPMMLVAALVRLDSSGPAFYRQPRVGQGGRMFEILKFRTMQQVAGASSDERNDAMTREGDDRITRLGRFLRRSRIDELPQIVNILRGEMSWIGPRPEARVLANWYEREVPFYAYRHIVKPGITGWAQVCQGHVTELESIKSKLYYDFYYIKNFSPWLDMVIVSLTIRTMLTGFGSR